jgi:D-threo-aldose 1-dehydrogenase
MDRARILLPGTNLEVPRLLFGTASLFNAGNGAARARVLDAAYDHGLTHFDTAPYYGFGVAERDLRPLLARRPDATVTTKVGIYSPGGEGQIAPLVLGRKAIGRLIPAMSQPTIDWSLPRAREALEGSLRRLGRDTIDLYLLHEPDNALLDTDEWLRWLEDVRRKGQVQRFGVAVDTARLRSFLDRPSALTQLIQTTDSLDRREADALTAAGRPMQITYGYVSAAMREAVSLDARAVLQAALARNASGAVIVSTRQPERMAVYSELMAGL